MIGIFLALTVLVASVSGRDLWEPRNLKRIVGGRQAAPPPVDDPVVYVVKDDEYARVYGDRQGRFPNSNYRFSGLRFAEPPVGRYRFQRSKMAKLSGEVSGLQYAPPCIQPDPNNPLKTIGSEDCLFLNVFTPRLPDSTKGLPVILWIHGGGFRRGSAAEYGGAYLARRDVVVVVPQYRLGSFGYLSNDDKDLPGNVALFDLALAAEWIKDYIKFFGGDPDNIVPMGQGSGGSSAMFMGLSNITQGRTKGIVAMSGSALSPSAIDDTPMSRTKNIAQETGCPTDSTLTMVKCMQQMSAEKIVAAESKLESREIDEKGVLGLGNVLTPSPVIEGENDRRFLLPYLEEDPKTSLEMEHVPKVPLLTGVTKHETGGAVTGGLREKVLDNLTKIPNYVNEVLIKDLVESQAKRLKSLTTLTGNTLNLLTGNYFGNQAKSVTDGINNIIEATTDALFNYPAFLTGEFWSKNNLPAYFYSFDHKGKLKKPSTLFGGSLLAGQEPDDSQIVSHGSELPYIFDLRSLDGTPDPQQNESTPLDPKDQKVRDFLLDMIVNFAKQKSVGGGGSKTTFPSYVSITPEPKFLDNFRQCQMQLWSGKKSDKPCNPLSLVTGSVMKGIEVLGAGKLLGQGTTGGNKASPSLFPKISSGRTSAFGSLFKQKRFL